MEGEDMRQILSTLGRSIRRTSSSKSISRSASNSSLASGESTDNLKKLVQKSSTDSLAETQDISLSSRSTSTSLSSTSYDDLPGLFLSSSRGDLQTLTEELYEEPSFEFTPGEVVKGFLADTVIQAQQTLTSGAKGVQKSVVEGASEIGEAAKEVVVETYESAVNIPKQIRELPAKVKEVSEGFPENAYEVAQQTKQSVEQSAKQTYDELAQVTQNSMETVAGIPKKIMEAPQTAKEAIEGFPNNAAEKMVKMAKSIKEEYWPSKDSMKLGMKLLAIQGTLTALANMLDDNPEKAPEKGPNEETRETTNVKEPENVKNPQSKETIENTGELKNAIEGAEQVTKGATKVAGEMKNAADVVGLVISPSKKIKAAANAAGALDLSGNFYRAFTKGEKPKGPISVAGYEIGRMAGFHDKEQLKSEDLDDTTKDFLKKLGIKVTKRGVIGDKNINGTEVQVENTDSEQKADSLSTDKKVDDNTNKETYRKRAPEKTVEAATTIKEGAQKTVKATQELATQTAETIQQAGTAAIDSMRPKRTQPPVNPSALEGLRPEQKSLAQKQIESNRSRLKDVLEEIKTRDNNGPNKFQKAAENSGPKLHGIR